MIDVQHMSRYYGDVAAVNDVSFKVEKGEIVGFLGPNAAGKTTTMRVLTSYLPATSGSVSVAGFDVLDDSMQVRKRIGYMPENPPLYQEMRVHDYLDFVAKIKGVEPADRKNAVQSALERTGCSQVSDRVIKVLSKGFKQRVGLAQALVHNPDLLILDEPTVGLDPNQIVEVRELIKSLAGEHTILLSTHILPEVSMTCERVIIINRGRVVAEDTPQNLAKKHAGTTRLLLSLDAPADEVKETLGNLSGVERIMQAGDSETGKPSFYVHSSAQVEIGPQVAKTVVEKGWPLYELKAEDVSLEDVFKRLTTTEEGGES
ncbi:MAG: ATP-binding cassette domain-containing protein [candidate division KSB1 bacterium]|nr:ATP-binding cassette domain-containing protein [candidate division KSB1 bacterium]